MNGLTLKEYEKFSAYLDGQLSPAENRKLEEQLKAHPDWRLAIEELAATRALLRRAPRYRAPRNFTLSPEVARQYARKSWLPSFISFRLSAAVAALSMIAALVLQLLPGAGLASRVAFSPAPETQANQAQFDATGAAEKSAESGPALVPEAGAQIEAPQAATASASSEQPAVIFWGSNSSIITSGSAYGLGGGGGGGGDGGGGGCNPGQPGCDVPENGIVSYNNEKVGSPMQGGAADTYAQPSAGGGGIVTLGGAPVQSSGPSGSTYIPPFDLPAATALPEQPPSTESQPTPETQREFAAVPLEGPGPILGLTGSDTAGEIIAEGPVNSVDSAVQGDQLDRTAAVNNAPDTFWSTARIVQAALVGVGLLAVILAVVLRRRS